MPRRKKASTEERPPEVKEAELDRDIAEDFQERQNLSEEGRDQLARKLQVHNSLSPEISAGDVDAAWDHGRESGEETFTGHAPTPDQDQVDAMGAAAGLTYKDDEPLQYGKVARRDDRRWELDPRSGQAEQAMEEEEAEEEDEDEAADADDEPLRFWDLADDLDAEVEEEYDDEDDEEDEEDADEEDEVTLAVDEDELEEDTDEAEADADEEDDADSDLDDDLLEADELDGDLDDELDDLDDDEDDLDDDDD